MADPSQTLALDEVQGHASLANAYPGPVTALPKYVKLVDITDLGDSGLMTVVDGELGVIAARKLIAVLPAIRPAGRKSFGGSMDARLINSLWRLMHSRVSVAGRAA